MCFSYFASPGSAHQLPSRTFPVVSLGAGTSFLPFIISRLDIVPILFNKAMNQLIDKKKKTFSILFPLSLFSLSLSPSSFLCLCFHPSSLVTVLFFFFVCCNFAIVHFYFLPRLILLLFLLRSPLRQVFNGSFFFEIHSPWTTEGDHGERSD